MFVALRQSRKTVRLSTVLHGIESCFPDSCHAGVVCRKSEFVVSWRNIPITVKTPVAGSMSEIPFHEKAGRSQLGSLVLWLDKGFLRAECATVAILPSGSRHYFVLCLMFL